MVIKKKILIDPRTDPETYKIISARYHRFIDAMADPKVAPVTVFDPLTKKHMDGLMLIREVSKTLQEKKEDDVKKAAEAKQAAEDARKEEAKIKKEEKLEESEKNKTEEKITEENKTEEKKTEENKTEEKKTE